MSPSVRRAALGVWLALLASACHELPGFRARLEPPPRPREFSVRVPATGELPGLVGETGRHRVAAGETLLDVARAADLGYQQVQDANPAADEWVPAPASDLVLPSRWILPRAEARGIVINIPEMRLYLFPEDAAPGKGVSVRTWPIGVGMETTKSPVGHFKIRTKEENPTWIVPASILKTMDPPRRVVPPGPDNPLGLYRMRLSYGLYAIHGTDSAWAIGRLTTHGCIRLYPEDIPELFRLVRVGTPGELLYQPVKVGEEDGRIFLEVHPDIYKRIPDLQRHALEEIRRARVADRVDPELVREAVERKSGVPTDVTRRGAVLLAPGALEEASGKADAGREHGTP